MGCVGELLGELCTNACPVRAGDANAVHGLRDVEARLRGRRDFLVAAQRRDEHDTPAGLVRRTAGNDELQIRPRVAQRRQHAGQPARLIRNGRRPHIHALDEKIHRHCSALEVPTGLMARPPINKLEHRLIELAEHTQPGRRRRRRSCWSR
jgi:hypothetical protein